MPWLIFEDALSPSTCDVVHAENAELVVLAETGNLVLVRGRDVILSESFVDAEGNVSFAGEPAGIIEFQQDGDGFRTLWWISLAGSVVAVDEFDGTPSISESVPDDFHNVACDACDFWDDDSVCAEPPPEPEPPTVTIRLCGDSIILPVATCFLLLPLVRRRPYPAPMTA